MKLYIAYAVLLTLALQVVKIPVPVRAPIAEGPPAPLVVGYENVTYPTASHEYLMWMTSAATATTTTEGTYDSVISPGNERVYTCTGR